jgi:hypothetical protein
MFKVIFKLQISQTYTHLQLIYISFILDKFLIPSHTLAHEHKPILLLAHQCLLPIPSSLSLTAHQCRTFPPPTASFFLECQHNHHPVHFRPPATQSVIARSLGHLQHVIRRPFPTPIPQLWFAPLALFFPKEGPRLAPQSPTFLASPFLSERQPELRLSL